jgi:hypothetical protein
LVCVFFFLKYALYLKLNIDKLNEQIKTLLLHW